MHEIIAINNEIFPKILISTDSNRNLIKTAKPAILLTTDRYNVTKEGDPW